MMLGEIQSTLNSTHTLNNMENGIMTPLLNKLIDIQTTGMIHTLTTEEPVEEELITLTNTLTKTHIAMKTTDTTTTM
jgi:hypothetical protein